MDHRSGLAPAGAAGPGGLVEADQAIFTSVRSSMGEGYRLVAMSPGVCAEERTELTRRSPSHDSLCLPAEEAVGLLSYRLAGGRRCVAYCCHAGREHTARGGWRVYTHIALLDPEAFDRFDNDPVRVHAAIGEAVGEPRLKCSPCLERLVLTTDAPPEATPVAGRIAADVAAEAENLCRLAGFLFSGQAVVTHGGTAPLESLSALMMALPAPVRRRLEVSVGLRYSPSRALQLVWLEGDPADARRALQGRDVQWLDWTGRAAAQAPSGPWFDLVRRRWCQGRFEDLYRLSSEMQAEPSDGDLDRVAMICHDMDGIVEAGQPDLERLVDKYGRYRPVNEVESRLVGQLVSAAVRRSATLRQTAGDAVRTATAPA